jgi:hypothetical protein
MTMKKTFPQTDPHCQSWRIGIDRETKEEKMRKTNFGKSMSQYFSSLFKDAFSSLFKDAFSSSDYIETFPNCGACPPRRGATQLVLWGERDFCMRVIFILNEIWTKGIKYIFR